MESVGSCMNMFDINCSRIQTNFNPKSRSPMQQPEHKTPLSRRCWCGGGGLRCLGQLIRRGLQYTCTSPWLGLRGSHLGMFLIPDPSTPNPHPKPLPKLKIPQTLHPKFRTLNRNPKPYQSLPYVPKTSAPR